MSGILKAEQLEAVRPFNYEDFHGRVEERLAAVRADCRELIEKAVAEAAEIRRVAEAEGREAGHERGMTDAGGTIAAEAEKLAEAEIDRQILNALPAVTAAVDAVADARDRFLVAQARVAVTLGVEIAARLLGRDETTLTEAAFAAAEEAFDVAVADARYTLAFHPDDHARLAERLAVVVESAGRLGDVSFVADESVPPGGCVLDGPHGAIDARLQTRLDRITAELLPAA